MRKTKKSLLLSITAMILCCALLAGTTFAWFTDSASTGVNQIIAGNLDIDVDYFDGTTWKPIEGEDSLFSDDLWEPGHTEYVYLRVKNAGSLALKYKVLVTPVSENGGISMKDGSNFKLSDYLVFGTTTPSENTITYADRNAARAAVAGSAQGLTVNNLTQSGEIKAGEADQYLALVVYMPEEVGNEANYKTGTAAPTIDLGIKVVATQLANESDSFDNQYDAGAANTPFYTVGAYYNYFSQVSASAPVVTDGETVITAMGKLNKNDTTEIPLATVTVPSTAVLNEGTTELTVKVVPKDPEASTTTGTALVAEIDNPNRETSNFDVKVEGIATSNTADIHVEIFVGKGLSNVKVYHNGALIEGTNYNPATGVVSFTTKSFSDYTVAYDVAAIAIGDKTYGSLAGAVDISKPGDTVKLLRDVRVEEGAVKVSKDLTIDLAGNTLTIANPSDDGLVVTNGATLNLTNSVANRGKYIFECTNPYADSIYVYNTENGKTSTLNIKNPVVLEINAATNSAIHAYGQYGNAVVNIEEGTEIKITGSDQTSAVIIDQNATVNMTGGLFDLNVDFDSFDQNKNDVVGVLLWGENGAQKNCTFNLSGGTFKVGGRNAFAQGIQIGMKNGYSDNVRANITGGSIVLNPTEDGEGYAFTAYNASYGKYTMSGGSVSGSLNALTATAYGTNADLTVTGGTFTIDPSAYVKTPYSVKEENGLYAVCLDVVLEQIAQKEITVGNGVTSGIRERFVEGKNVLLTTDVNITGKAVNDVAQNDTYWQGNHYIYSDGVFTDITAGIIVPNGKNVVLNLGGKTLTIDHCNWIVAAGIYVEEGATLTIVNGTLDASGTMGELAVLTAEGATVNIDSSVTVKGEVCSLSEVEVG